MICPEQFPAEVQRLFAYFASHDVSLYLVGGAVRDWLRGVRPKDYDFTVGLDPQQLQSLLTASDFSLDLKGLKFGTIGVILNGQSYEISSHRREAGYEDLRHPNAVAFDVTLEEDLARRDFTINAMAWSPETGLIDPYGGQADLERGLIRAVGDPQKRIKEDALRGLRALRFAASLDFQLEVNTRKAVLNSKQGLLTLPAERVGEELWKLISGDKALAILQVYPWLWQSVLCIAEEPELFVGIPQDIEKLQLEDAISRLAYLFSLDFVARDKRFRVSEVLDTLALIHHRDELADYRALRPLIQEDFPLRSCERALEAWAFPAEIRLKILLSLVDICLGQRIEALDLKAASILWSVERYERVQNVSKALGGASFPWSKSELMEMRGSLPLDQADLAWDAKELMAQGYRGPAIKQRRAEGLLDIWLSKEEESTP